MQNLLWIEDNPSPDFMTVANSYGFDVHVYECAKPGMAELERTPRKFHAVILDVLGHLESKDGDPSEESLIYCINKLIALAGRGIYIPYVIYSANANNQFSDDRFNIFTSDILKFRKDLSGTREMFKTINELLANKLTVQIEKDYHQAFELCRDKYIGQEYHKDLLALLSIVEDKTKSYEHEDYIPKIRFILEGISNKFTRIGIIPQKGVSHKQISQTLFPMHANLNWEFDVLMGKANGLANSIELFPPLICDLIEHVIDISEDGHHKRSRLALNVINFIEKNNAKYVLNGIVFYLLEIMIWCKKVFDDNPNMDKNQTIVFDNIALVEFDFKLNSYFCRNQSGSYSLGNKEFIQGSKIRILKYVKNHDRNSPFDFYVTKYDKNIN
jgi:hypothetical protein